MAESKKLKKKRSEYQVHWQRRYRNFLSSQGLKQIRIICHEDFEEELKNIARRDIKRRNLSTSILGEKK